MASIRDLKRDINNVYGGIIDAVYIIEDTEGDAVSKQGSKIIDEAITEFDTIIEKVNDKSVKDRAAHLKEVRKEFLQKAGKLKEQVNALG